MLLVSVSCPAGVYLPVSCPADVYLPPLTCPAGVYLPPVSCPAGVYLAPVSCPAGVSQLSCSVVCVSICGPLVTSYRSDAGSGRARHCGAQVDQYNEAHARLEVEARVHMGGACFQCATGDREERESNCTLLSSLALLFLPLSRQLRYTPRTRSSTPASPLPFPGHPAPHLTITPTSQPPLFVHLACFRQGAGSERVHVTGFFLTGL